MSWGYDLLDRSMSIEDGYRTAWTLASTEVLVVDCEAARISAIAHGMPADRIVRLPWGTDLETFRPRGPDERERERRARGWGREVVVASTRAHEPVYGVDVVLDGFSVALATVPTMRLIVGGNGTLTDDLQARAVRNRSSHRVEFVGQLRPSELAGVLGLADVYVSASHIDGSSVTLLEAMASGLPSIVSAVGGNAEWVVPGNNGALFPDGSADALGAALVEIASMDDGARKKMGAHARQVTADRADWRRNRWLLAGAYEMAVRSPR